VIGGPCRALFAAQLGDPQVDVPHLGGEQPRPVAVAVAKALLAALVVLGAEHYERSDLQLDQLLQAMAQVTGLPTPCNANRWSSGAELVRRALNPGYAGVEVPREFPPLPGTRAARGTSPGVG